MVQILIGFKNFEIVELWSFICLVMIGFTAFDVRFVTTTHLIFYGILKREMGYFEYAFQNLTEVTSSTMKDGEQDIELFV